MTDVTYTPYVPALSITPADAEEGNNLTYTVTLDQPTTVDIRVDYAVDHPGGSGSASSGDYTATSGTLTIATGATQGTINVATVEDSLAEPNESVRLTLSSPVRATIAESSDLAYIINDDTPPTFSINDASATEGGTITFTVTKANAAAQSHSVSYSTASGTATSGTDFPATSGTLTFGSSETSKTLTVQTTQDSTIESDETLYVNLSSPTGGALIGDGQGVGTILNDDQPNSPPNAVNNTYNYLETCCSPVPTRNIYPLNNDSDPDGDPLSIISITQPNSGGVTATLMSSTHIRLNVSVTWYYGTMTYTISDGNGGTDTATITISIEEDE